jgi:hypothetical protein
MIPADEFRKDGEALNIDEQINVNHVMCPAGTDVRRRLYIRRTPEAVLAYCHNCGQHGFVALRNTILPLADLLREHSTRLERECSPADALVLPEDMMSAPSLWPDEFVKWVNKYGIQADYLSARFDFGYSPSYNRLIMPVYENGRLVFWQGRGLSSTSPKYLSCQAHNKVVFEALSLSKKITTAVVCEDILSAIKCYLTFDSKVDAFALLGTSADINVLRKKLDHYAVVHLFLDADRPGKMASTELTKRLSLVLPALVIDHTLPKQPKEMTPTELREEMVVGR